MSRLNLTEKGRNLATKEDIAAITREVEQVRHEYTTLVEELKARHQLRLAALDRRLQAHQEAFTNWRKLTSGSKNSGEAVLECQTWWEANCLYLEPKVREAFLVAFNSELSRSQYVQARSDSKYISEAWEKVMAFPKVLFDAVQLPTLTDTETRSLNIQQPSRKDNG